MIDENRAYFANRAAEEAEAAVAAAGRGDREAAAAHRTLQRRYLEQVSVVGRDPEMIEPMPAGGQPQVAR